MADDALEKLNAPAKVKTALELLRASLLHAGGDNVKALLVYGALARGTFRPGASDVDVALVLGSASPTSLRAIAPALRTAFRSARVDPLILTQDDLAHAVDVFPTKFLSLQRQRVLLAGEDPFVALTIPREHVRLRVEQELRNVAVRLRRRYLVVHEDDTAVHALLRSVGPSVEAALHGLLWLEGDALGAREVSPAEVFREAAQRFGLDAEALSELHEDHSAGPGPEVLERVFRALDQAVAVADRWTGGGATASGRVA